MAGDWIKYRAELFSHPRFLALVSELVYIADSPGLLAYAVGDDNLTAGYGGSSDETVTSRALRCVTEAALRDVTMCALLRVWCAVNAHCKLDGSDAVMHPMSLMDLDPIAGFDGFGDALAAVGWVAEDGHKSLRFRNFAEYNEPACLRAKPKTNAERQKEFRDRQRAPKGKSERVTSVTKSNAREEKRREEEKEEIPPSPPPGGDGSQPAPKPSRPKPNPAESVPLPESLDAPEFRGAWADWLADRKARRKPLTELAARQQLASLAAYPVAAAVAAIRKSIASGWQGLFPEREAAQPATLPFRGPGGGKKTVADLIAEARAKREAEAARAANNTEATGT